MSERGDENPLYGFPRPDMLPPDTDLVGRDKDLSELARFLADARASAERHRPARIGIYGEPGVGKSALGTAFSYSIEDQYPDGTLYADLNDAPALDGVPDFSQILRRFLQELKRSPDRLPQDAQDLPHEFIRATDRKHLIVFLDNVRDLRSVRDLIPRSSTCLVLFTSNGRLPDDRVQSLKVTSLSDDAAVELFGKIAPSRHVADARGREQLVEVLSACAGLPIAIRVLAARLEDNPGYTLERIREDLDRYQGEPYLTDLFGAGRHTIEACFRVSYGALNDVQSMLFRRLGVAPGESFDVPLGAYLGDLTADGARLVIDELCELQLVLRTQDPDFFRMHRLWRGFAREQLDDTEATDQLTRALSFYCEQAEDADQVIRSLQPTHNPRWSGRQTGRISRQRNPALERDMALEWMEKQHRNLVAAAKRACDENLVDIAWRTCRALVEFFEIRGEWESWEQTYEATREIVPPQSQGFAQVNYGLGRLNAATRSWEKAIEHYRCAIAVFRLNDEQVQVGRTLNALGDAYRYMRNWDAAENCFARSLEILEEAHHLHQVAIAKRSMSTIHRQRGQFEEAEDLCRQAIATFEAERIPDQRWIAATKLSLADIYLDSGSKDARGLLEECLDIFSKLKDTHWLILTRRSLGEALREDDRYAEALEQLELCRESLRKTRDDHWAGQILHSMGLVYLDMGDPARARALFDDALEMFRESRDTLWEGRTQVSIGRAAAADGRVTEARTAYHAAWPLLVEQGAREDLKRLETWLDRLPRDPETPEQDGGRA